MTRHSSDMSTLSSKGKLRKINTNLSSAKFAQNGKGYITIDSQNDSDVGGVFSMCKGLNQVMHSHSLVLYSFK